MRGGDGDEHDLRFRPEHADAVDDAGGADAEAGDGHVDHRFKGRLGHARVVFELERVDGVAVTAVAHGADEDDDGADTAVAAAQRHDLGVDVEIVGADRDPRGGGRRLSHR